MPKPRDSSAWTCGKRQLTPAAKSLHRSSTFLPGHCGSATGASSALQPGCSSWGCSLPPLDSSKGQWQTSLGTALSHLPHLPLKTKLVASAFVPSQRWWLDCVEVPELWGSHRSRKAHSWSWEAEILPRNTTGLSCVLSGFCSLCCSLWLGVWNREAAPGVRALRHCLSCVQSSASLQRKALQKGL